MKTDLLPYLHTIAAGRTLSEAEARAAFNILLTGEATPSQIGAFLMGLRQRGETIDEITGAAHVLIDGAKHIKAPKDAIDTCGTGGDATGSYNISTAVAIVLAACGVPVAKHGNRSITSRSGSADVLATLGVNIEADIPTLERCLEECRICFMMAPLFHEGMRHVASARKEMGMRTIFNLLGPLANPARTKKQLLGVYAREWVKPLAQVLMKLGVENAWVVHGADGMDELSLSGPSFVATLNHGEIRSFEIAPSDAGLKTVEREALQGGDPKHNAQALRNLLSGESGAYRDAVLLNAAAALVIADRVENLSRGAVIASNAIDTGAAEQTLNKLIKISNS